MFRLYVISMMFFWSTNEPLAERICQQRAMELNKVLSTKPKGVDALAICIPVKTSDQD